MINEQTRISFAFKRNKIPEKIREYPLIGLSNPFQAIIYRITDFKIKVVFIGFSCLVGSTALAAAGSLFMNPDTAGMQFPYLAYVPSYFTTELKLFTFSVSVTWTALMIVAHDCIIMSLMNHICCQLQILGVALKDVPWVNGIQNQGQDGQDQQDSESEVNTSYTEGELLQQIKWCVHHHQTIIAMRNEVESIFSMMLLWQFLTSLFIFGLTGFQATVTQQNEYQFIIYAYCCCIFSELFIYCWFANQIIEEVSFIEGFAT